jgi:hypothetical protein
VAADIDGFLAVLLWHENRRTKDPRFLKTLLAYNVSDAVNLEALMVCGFNLNVQHTPFTDLALDVPTPPPSMFRVDAAAVAKGGRRMWSSDPEPSSRRPAANRMASPADFSCGAAGLVLQSE